MKYMVREFHVGMNEDVYFRTCVWLRFEFGGRDATTYGGKVMVAIVVVMNIHIQWLKW